MHTSEAFEAVSAEQIAAARRLGEENARREPLARAIAVDTGARRATLTLQGDVTLGFPLEALHEMASATPDQLAGLTIDHAGRSISCRPLDIDISVEGLILDLLGTPWKQAMRAALVRDASKKRTQATAVAARENGKKGGRPRKAIAERSGPSTRTLGPDQESFR